MLTGLNHLTLAVREIEPAVRFYQGLLDFQLAARWDHGAYLSLGDLWLCLSLDERDTPSAAGDYTHYAFSISAAAFADFVAKLRKAGVREWKDNTSEGASFYFLDPYDHRLEAHVGSLATRLDACRRHPYPGMRILV